MNRINDSLALLRAIDFSRTNYKRITYEFDASDEHQHSIELQSYRTYKIRVRVVPNADKRGQPY